MSNEPKFDEQKELDKAKQYLLAAITDKAGNTAPPQDALNYAVAYAHLVNTEMKKKEAAKNVNK